MVTVKSMWAVQDAKARFSEMLDTCLSRGPQVISRRGVPEAVIVPVPLWEEVSSRHATLKDLLLQPTGRFDFELPKRGQGQHRNSEEI